MILETIVEDKKKRLAEQKTKRQRTGNESVGRGSINRSITVFIRH